MERDTYPSERYTCLRCGLARVRNAGIKRRAKATGLCRDCWLAQRWTCPLCQSTMSISVKGPHLKHSHNLSIAEMEEKA